MRTSYRNILLSLLFFNLTTSHLFADEEIPLIAQDGVWKYLDDGTDLGTAWREPNFDDSAWPSGAAGLGFGNRGILTTLDRGPSTARNVTFYFRKEFNVTSAQLNSLEGDDPFYQILLGLQRDDGAVIYINGQELHRDICLQVKLLGVLLPQVLRVELQRPSFLNPLLKGQEHWCQVKT